MGSWTNKISASAHKNGEWQKVQYKNTRTKIQPQTPLKFAPAFPAIGRVVVHKPIGSWGKKLKVTNADTVRGAGVIKCGFKKRVSSKTQTHSCAYCHDEVNIHHIRDCPILAAKNRALGQAKHKQKQEMRSAQLEQAEAILAAKFATHPVDEAINRGHVSVRSKPKKVGLKDNRFDGFDEDETFVTKRVSFKGDDVDTLMKPPCKTKIFNADAPVTAVSRDEENQAYPEEEEYLKLKRSKTAWKPKFQITSPGPHLTASNKNVKKERWADICDDESDDDEDEISGTIDRFCRPTTDNSAW